MTDTQYKYIAFISYRHNAADDNVKLDEQWARKIQDTLESYRLPNAVFKSVYKAEKRILPKRLYPIFRDASDLGPGTLKDSLEQNLKDSKYLIVICTPRTAQPNEDGKLWVDEEVKYFADSLGRQDRIIPILVSGTPSESFVPTLKKYDCLALDVGKFSQERIVNDIVAKILGLNPDELWNRELRRRKRQRIRRCLIATCVAALCAFGTWFAYDWQTEKKLYFRDYVDVYGIPQGVCPLTPEEVARRGQSYRLHYRGYDDWRPWRRKPILRQMVSVNAFDTPVAADTSLPMHPNIAIWQFVYSANNRPIEIKHATPSGYVKTKFKIWDEQATVIDIVRRGWDGRWGTPENMVHGLIEPKRTDKISRYNLRRNTKGHLLSILYCRDAKNTPAIDSDGVSRIEFSVDQEGRIVRERKCSWDGDTVSINGKGNPNVYEYSSSGDLSRQYSTVSSNNVKVTEFVYDREGNCTRRTIYSEGCAASSNSMMTVRFLYDQNGCLVRKDYIDPANSVERRQDQCHIVSNVYLNGSLNKTFVRYFDNLGRTVKNHEGYVGEEKTYNGDGLVVEWKLLDFQKCARGEDQVAMKRTVYDDHLRETSEQFFDEHGNPVLTTGGYALAKREYCVTNNDSLSYTVRWYDVKNNPVKATALGCAVDFVLYDEKGHPRVCREYDENGNPMLCKEGWHETVFGYDRFGYLSSIEYYDCNGGSVLASSITDQICAGLSLKHDEVGNLLERTYLGLDKKAMNGAKGFSTVRWQYDEKGRETDVFLLDVNGLAVKPKGGDNYHTHYEYDTTGRKISATFYGVDGRYYFHRFDSNGRCVRTEYYAADGSRLIDDMGIWAVEYGFSPDNTSDKEISRRFLGKDGKLALNNEHLAGWNIQYDNRGRHVEKSYVGDRGELKEDYTHVAIIRWEYDTNGYNIAESYYNKHTNLVANYEGRAGWRREFDSNGRKIKEYIVGNDGRPFNDGDNVFVNHYEYNASGMCTGRFFYDENDQPTVSKAGIHGWRTRWLTDGTKERRFVGTNGVYVLNAEKYGGWQRKYDSQNRIISEVYLDERGCIKSRKELSSGNEIVYDRIIYNYASSGKVGQIAIADGGPTICGCWRMHTVTGANGMENVRFEDASGGLMNSTLGYATKKIAYNRDGEKIEESFWSESDAAAETVKEGFHRTVIRRVRNKGGMQLQLMCFGKNNFPVNQKNVGWSSLVYGFDNKHRLVMAEALDCRGQPVAVFESGTRSHVEIEYDEKDRVQEVWFVDRTKIGKDSEGGTIGGGIKTLSVSQAESIEGYRVIYSDANDENVIISFMDRNRHEKSSRKVSWTEKDRRELCPYLYVRYCKEMFQ